MNIANESELDQFIKEYPEINMLEILMPDMNGIVRCKRIPRGEFGTFFRHGVKGPASTTSLHVRGELLIEVDFVGIVAEPDQLILTIANILVPITCL